MKQIPADWKGNTGSHRTENVASKIPSVARTSACCAQKSCQIKIHAAFDPVKPHEQEQMLKLSRITTWSFRCCLRHGGLNWGLVSLPIKENRQTPTLPLCYHFDICVKQGLWQILPLQTQSSYLGKSQLSGCVIACMHVSYISMMPPLPYQHTRLCVCACRQHQICLGVPAPGSNWHAQAPCFGLSPGGQLGCPCSLRQTTAHGECIDAVSLVVRINCDVQGKRANKASIDEDICQALSVPVFGSTDCL